MQDTTVLRPKTSGRFNSLMELYENNYILIRLLAPGLRTYSKKVYLSQPDGVLPLELSDIEHNKYTTTFKLTYLFSGNTRQRRAPDLTIRLYHDACTCEVMSGLIPSRRLELRRTRDLDDGYRLNRFLHKWMSYCLRQGHAFEALPQGTSKVRNSQSPATRKAAKLSQPG